MIWILPMWPVVHHLLHKGSLYDAEQAKRCLQFPGGATFYIITLSMECFRNLYLGQIKINLNYFIFDMIYLLCISLDMGGRMSDCMNVPVTYIPFNVVDISFLLVNTCNKYQTHSGP